MRVTEITRLATAPIDRLVAEARLGKPAPSDLMLQGTAWHALILRGNRLTSEAPVELEIIEADNYRTKLAQEARNHALAHNRTPILRKDYTSAVKSIDFLASALDSIMPQGAIYEQEFKGKVDYFGEIVGHIDCLTEAEVIDLKISAKGGDFNKLIFDNGYQLQVFLYMHLSNRTQAKLVFINPESLVTTIKTLHYYEIQTECEALLKLAHEKQAKLQEALESPLIQTSDYATPQWAYTNLIQGE